MIKANVKIFFIFLGLLWGLLPVFPISQNNSNAYIFSSYMKQLRERIVSYWRTVYYPEAQGTVMIYMKVAKNGDLLDCNIAESSGIKSLDDSAITAVKHLAPFEPLPAGYDKDFVKIKFAFQTNLTQTSTIDKILFPDELVVTGKNYIIRDNLYVYLNALERNPSNNIISFTRYKIDCRNNLIGHLKPESFSHGKTFLYGDKVKLANVEKLEQQIQMKPINKNPHFHYQLIYNYACTK